MENSTNTAHFTPTIYECEYCFITCNKISDWKRHIMTKKHFVNKNGGISTMETNTFICECGNIYKERTGLWKHKKKCQYNKKNEDLNENHNENLNENIIEKFSKYILKSKYIFNWNKGLTITKFDYKNKIF